MIVGQLHVVINNIKIPHIANYIFLPLGVRMREEWEPIHICFKKPGGNLG